MAKVVDLVERVNRKIEKNSSKEVLEWYQRVCYRVKGRPYEEIRTK